MQTPIDVSLDDLRMVQAIVRQFVPEAEVWAFGSRVRWAARDSSDLDLAVKAGKPLGNERLADLNDAFEAADLPFRVDVVDLSAVSPRFRALIEKEYVVLQRKNEEPRWDLYRLEEACEIYDGPHATPVKTPEGPVFLGISNLVDGRLVLDQVEHLSEEDFKKWTRRVEPRAGDVVFSYETRLGEAALIPEGLRCCLGRRMGLLRPKADRVDSRYLLYAYLGPEFQETIRARTIHGSTVDRIPLLEMGGFPIRLPPLPEQRAIAHILGTLDDKIDLNRRMNETLEAMARALFKSWFVDFEPVRAKAEGRDPGLPREVADLFPSRFVESELGEIPEGWEMRGLDEVARFLNGLAMQKYPPGDGPSLPVIKIAQLRAGDTKHADRASAALDRDFIVNDGDILFSWSGSLECILWAGGPGALNQYLFKVTSERYPRWLCYLGIHQHLDDFRYIAAGKATTMGHIQRHHLTAAKLTVPSATLLSATDRLIGPIVESSWKRKVECRTLAALRDTLLPKLISGELRVKDAERFVERAAH